MHLFNVPVIRADLRHEETIIQTTNAFDYLDRVIDDVFNKIDERIKCNNIRIDGISNRINVANNKINNLIGINKALKIFSSAKYPAATRSIEPTATFTYVNRSKIELSTDYNVLSRFDPISHRDINKKLQFYHVAARTRDSNAAYTQKRLLSMHLESIDTALLFNETVNMYTDENSDRARGCVASKTAKESIESSSKFQTTASPLPILHRKIGTKNKMNESLFYSPGVSDAPQIDVPHDLPDLPGIADDIAFNMMGPDDLDILPNPMNTNIINLPAVSITNPEPYIDKSKSNSSIPTPSDVAQPMALTAHVSATQPSLQLPPRALPPPPPLPPLPPPPPPPPPADQKTIEKLPPKKKIQQEESSNLHSNLMAAIRQAGGASKAKLRAAQLCPEKMDASFKAPSAPGGDLMADLHNKLAMRRKGISGTKDIDSKINAAKTAAAATTPADSGPNLINRLSAMIPPPSHDSNSDESDADDWN